MVVVSLILIFFVCGVQSRFALYWERFRSCGGSILFRAALEFVMGVMDLNSL